MEVLKNNVLTSKQEEKIKRIYTFNSLSNFINNYRQDFINLGYEDGLDIERITIGREDSIWNSYLPMIKLYLKAFDALPLNVIESSLEVGSGLGGGCYLLKKYFNILNVYGVDANYWHVLISKIKFGNRGISFRRYGSENFTKLEMKFDLIYSIEASSHFSNLTSFFSDVNKSLTDGGFFVYLDLFNEHQIDKIENEIYANGFRLVKKENINMGVLNSIKLNFQHKPTGFFNGIRTRIQSSFGMEPNESSELFTKIENGVFLYNKYVFQKAKR